MDREFKLGEKLLFYPKANLLVDESDTAEVSTLGSNETRLLQYLIDNRERAVSRRELISVLWNDRDIFVDDSSLTQSVSTLRKALKDSTRFPTYIKTVPKFGYEFIAAVEKLGLSPLKSTINNGSIKNDVSTQSTKYTEAVKSPHVSVTNSMLLRYSLFNTFLVGVSLLKPKLLSAAVAIFSYLHF
ncbi:transcriptional regulator [Vibrio panuliri]|uniref:OmpR/PhoB-type domain-containing protein n=1 Tax=Vibrio panuliri TaxID=1381081 RepID=A0ABX3FCA4_9VIBR|nr:winged helix-turn-helix domain-containing protein [Vibrio panuliri]KAB1458280.1 hypothetical protein F7O85_11300 [Vibrio panuliri]OLQ86806.1 hypothetical protein BIY20_02640 [Vibrio panuliri]